MVQRQDQLSVTMRLLSELAQGRLEQKTGLLAEELQVIQSPDPCPTPMGILEVQFREDWIKQDLI